MTKRYKVVIYDEKAIRGYCVLDLENPSQTARLKYNNVFISTKEGCNIVCDLLNELADENEQLKKELKYFCNIITLTKAIELLNIIYDKYLYASPSDTIAEAKRKGIKECMDTLENYLEDLDV